MANRRKFLAGVGSLAAGSAAAIGSGAFSVASVDRDLTVSTTGDDSAYLGLVPDSEYAEIDSDRLSLTFDQLNENANFSFRNVFYVQNNGQNDIRVQITDGTEGISFADDSPLVVSYTDTRDDGTAYTNLNVFPNSPNWLGDTVYGHGGPDSSDAITGFLDLSPGDFAFIHFDFFLKNDDSAASTNANTSGEANNPQNISSVPSEIGFYASAVPEDGAL